MRILVAQNPEHAQIRLTSNFCRAACSCGHETFRIAEEETLMYAKEQTEACDVLLLAIAAQNQNPENQLNQTLKSLKVLHPSLWGMKSLLFAEIFDPDGRQKAKLEKAYQYWVQYLNFNSLGTVIASKNDDQENFLEPGLVDQASLMGLYIDQL